MKAINLMHPRLPLPAEGPIPGLLGLDLDEGFEDRGRARKKAPFITQRSVILTLLVVGVVSLVWGVFYRLDRPADFSEKPRLETPGSADAQRAAALKPPTPIATRPDVPKPRPVTMPGKPPPTPKKPSPNVPAAVLLTDAGEKDRKPGPTTFKKETVAPPKASRKTASVLSSAASTLKAPEAPPAPTKKKTLASGSMPQKATPKLPPKPRKAETPAAKVESRVAKVAKPEISPPKPGKAETPPAKPAKVESPPTRPAKVESRPAKPAKVEDQPPRTVKALPPKAKPKAPLKSVKEKAQGLTRVARVRAPALKRARRPVRPRRTAAVRTGRYSVRVAACRKAKCVRWFRNRIKALGLESYIRKSRNRKLTLVQVGSYLTLKETKAEIERLKKKGFKGPYAVKR